jgi:hypothetical protein
MAPDELRSPAGERRRGRRPTRRKAHKRRRPIVRRFGRLPKHWKLIPVALIGLILAFAVLAVVAAFFGSRPLRNGVNELSAAIAAVHADNRAAATKDLDSATSDFAQAHSSLTVWWSEPAELLPGVRQQLNALRSVAGAGGKVCSAGLDVDTALKSTSLPHGAALISMLRQVDLTLSRAKGSLAAADRQVSGARSSWLLPPISSRLDEALPKVSEASHDDQVAIASVAAAVQFLGGDGPRSYFLAVETEAESRASGGVIDDYGIVTANDGILRLTRFGATRPLQSRGDRTTRKLIAPAAYIARYGQFDPASFWANVPMSPDFPTVAKVIEGLYPQEGGSAVDGVISVDPFALADLLKATGPIDVNPWPTAITSENAVAVLLHDEYDALSGTTRTNFLGDVAKTAWQRFTEGHLPDLETLVRDLSPAFARKDLLLQSTSPATEALIRQIGASGAFSAPADSDFLAVTSQDTIDNKIDWYLRRSIDYHVSYVPRTGAISATVTVSLDNLAPTKGQPSYVLGVGGKNMTPGESDKNTTPGENGSYITIYTPWVLTSATIDGHVLALTRSRELGVWADSAFVTVPPGGMTTISAQLSGHLRPGSPYRLTMSRQPMVEPDEMILTVQLPAGYHFTDPSTDLSLGPGGREATAGFEFESNTSFSASVTG